MIYRLEWKHCAVVDLMLRLRTSLRRLQCERFKNGRTVDYTLCAQRPEPSVAFGGTELEFSQA